MGGTDVTFDVFRRAEPSAGFSDWLRASSSAAWDAMVNHRFVRDVAADTLPPEVFVRYLRYEHAFVRSAISIFAYALAKAPTASDQTHLVRVLEALANDQDLYFQKTFAELDVDAGILDSRALPGSAVGLREGVMGIAAQGSFEEILSAMLAAEWMYHAWCTEAHAAGPKSPQAAAWVDLHVADDFAAQVQWLRQRLDALGPQLSPVRQDRCGFVFGYVLNLEIAFHDAPYEPA